MPHWLYWAGLLVFPVVAIALVRRERQRGPGPGVNLFTAYLFWLLSGFVGLHRFYLKNLGAFVFIPVFAFILWGNGNARDMREDVSRTKQQFEIATRAHARAESAVRANRPNAAETLARADETLGKAKTEYDAAQAEKSKWDRVAGYAAALLGAMLLVDAALLPRLVRRVREREGNRAGEITELPTAPPPAFVEPTASDVRTRFTDAIDGFSTAVGTYVAYWALLSVFFYYYEVVARFVFNSPTNWVHESMFLMFGMQYLYSGALAYRDESHVRVDIFYAKFSARGKAIADIGTSIFFFIFTVTMFWTGARFAMDAIGVGEHSFTEWGIQYWPVKLAIPIGAFMMILQGISKLVKDVLFVTGGAAPSAVHVQPSHLGA